MEGVDHARYAKEAGRSFLYKHKTRRAALHLGCRVLEACKDSNEMTQLDREYGLEQHILKAAYGAYVCLPRAYDRVIYCDAKYVAIP